LKAITVLKGKSVALKAPTFAWRFTLLAMLTVHFTGTVAGPIQNRWPWKVIMPPIYEIFLPIFCLSTQSSFPLSFAVDSSAGVASIFISK